MQNFLVQSKIDPELKPWIEKKQGWTMLRHPLVFGVPYMEEMNSLYNAQLKQKKEYAQKALENKDWNQYLYIHERPYRFNKFIEIKNLMSDKEYWHNLGSIWSDSENIWQYGNIIKDLLTSERKQKEQFMNKAERDFFKKLPEKFIIYRGHQKLNRKGYSWSLSYWHACWFAQRFESVKHGILQATVSKKDIIGVLLRRGEYEIVALPNNLKTETYKKITKRPVWIESIFRKAISEFKLNQSKSFHGI
jgi:hypothetical protein